MVCPSRGALIDEPTPDPIEIPDPRAPIRAAPVPDVVKVDFRVPRFWSRRLGLVLMGAVLLGITGAQMVGETLAATPSPMESLGWVALVFGGVLVVVGGILGAHWWLLPKEGPVLEIHPDHLVLPRSARSRFRHEVPLSDLRSIDLRISPAGGTVIMDTERRIFIYDVASLVDVKQLEMFRRVLRARIEKQPDGQRILGDIAQRRVLAQEAFSRSPIATNVLILILSIAFGIEYFNVDLAASVSMDLVELGANVRELVFDGEWYRLVVANLLHGGPFHFLINAFSLMVFGGLVERVLGPWRLTAAFLITGVTGAVFSLFLSQGMFSVGASTSIFGIFGLYGVATWRHRRLLPAIFHLHPRWWVLIIGLNVAILFVPYIGQMIDWAGHLGGLVGGGLVGLFFTWRPASVDPRIKTPTWIQAVAAVSIALYGGATLAAARIHAEGVESRLEHLTRLYLENPDIDAGRLNAGAWGLAIRRDISREGLELALEAAEKAHQLEPKQVEITDTLAQVHHRLGDNRKAVELELSVVEAGDERVRTYASNLARFLHSRANLEPHDGSPAPAAALVPLALTEDETGFQVTPEAPLEQATVVYALRLVKDRPIGLVRLCLPKGLAEPTPVKTPMAQAALKWGPKSTLTVAETRPGDCPAPRAQVWVMDGEVRDLP